MSVNDSFSIWNAKYIIVTFTACDMIFFLLPILELRHACGVKLHFLNSETRTGAFHNVSGHIGSTILPVVLKDKFDVTNPSGSKFYTLGVNHLRQAQSQVDLTQPVQVCKTLLIFIVLFLFLTFSVQGSSFSVRALLFLRSCDIQG